MTKLIECDKCGKTNLPIEGNYHLVIHEINTDLTTNDLIIYEIDLCRQCAIDTKTYIGMKTQ